MIDLDDDKWFLLMDRLDDVLLYWNKITSHLLNKIVEKNKTWPSNSDLPFSLYLAAALSSRNGQQLGLSHK